MVSSVMLTSVRLKREAALEGADVQVAFRPFKNCSASNDNAWTAKGSPAQPVDAYTLTRCASAAALAFVQSNVA